MKSQKLMAEAQLIYYKTDCGFFIVKNRLGEVDVTVTSEELDVMKGEIKNLSPDQKVVFIDLTNNQ